MANDRIAVHGQNCNPNDNITEDILLTGIRAFIQSVMEAEVEQLTGASKHERSDSRTTHRNGYRQREWVTRLGNINLQIPRLRTGSYFPSFLEAYKRTERAVLAVVQEAYVKGVSTRKMDDLVQAMGIEGLDKSAVSRICAELDEEFEAFQQRPLDSGYVYLWLDATYVKVREPGRVCTKAVVVATAVTKEGEREIVGVDIGDSENGPFWKEFLRSIRRRGLQDVQLVTSDAHVGLRKAIAETFAGSSWQRCRVHFFRNVLATVRKNYQQMVAASVKTIFLQPDAETARAQLREIGQKLQPKFPKVSTMLEEAQEDLLAFYAFPAEHRRKIWSTNPIERIMKELKRRTKVVGLFPNERSALRLTGAVLIEQNEQWAVSEKRYLSLKSMRELLEGEIAPDEDPFLPNQAALGR